MGAAAYSAMRDLEKRPYSADEKRVAEWWSTKIGVGGGDDPIGCLIVSHEVLAADRQYYRSLIRRFRDYTNKMISGSPPSPSGGAHHDPIWAEVADALD